jgi:predicted mannosyl-3-phosphoglycerate phosphatase (HAD superfamily)
MTKAEQAQQIFTEVNGVRADFMKRVMEELGMSKAGSSTYFQTCKTRAAGGKVKYYSKKAEKSTVEPTVDDSMEDAPLFEVALGDGTTKCFLSQEAADEFKATL